LKFLAQYANRVAAVTVVVANPPAPSQASPQPRQVIAYSETICDREQSSLSTVELDWH